eukprot:12504888-Alexandrium_andersonii.AAC.1
MNACGHARQCTRTHACTHACTHARTHAYRGGVNILAVLAGGSGVMKVLDGRPKHMTPIRVTFSGAWVAFGGGTGNT